MNSSQQDCMLAEFVLQVELRDLGTSGTNNLIVHNMHFQPRTSVKQDNIQLFALSATRFFSTFSAVSTEHETSAHATFSFPADVKHTHSAPTGIFQWGRERTKGAKKQTAVRGEGCSSSNLPRATKQESGFRQVAKYVWASCNRDETPSCRDAKSSCQKCLCVLTLSYILFILFMWNAFQKPAEIQGHPSVIHCTTKGMKMKTLWNSQLSGLWRHT